MSKAEQKQVSTYTTTNWGWGRKEAPQSEVLAWDLFSFKFYLGTLLIVPAALLFYQFNFSFNFWSFLTYVILVILLALPILAVFLIVHSRLVGTDTPYQDGFIEFTNDEFKSQWKGRKIPILILYEAYFAQKLRFNGDLLELLYKRYHFADFVFTWGHVQFFLLQFIPELLAHTRIQDTTQVRDHYDRGNDFYGWFLGETMIYTSGIFENENDTLEQAQKNKLNLVCNKIHLKKGESLLDIGCGWGTLVIHAASEFGADCTGVTLAKEQTQFAMERIKKRQVQDSARILCMDYRDIPEATKFRRYNKITCLEMAEHVGVKYFNAFLRQVSNMLEDDGIFYLQIAGLRRAWQYEDLMWGCFMGKYVFPGADASCPLGWVVNQLEVAGFEVHSVETIGVHYSATIKRWYDNWVSNREQVVKKYGEEWYRKWLWFLAWAVISPEQGSATCYQIVCHKNTRAFDRKSQFIAERANWKI